MRDQPDEIVKERFGILVSISFHCRPTYPMRSIESRAVRMYDMCSKIVRFSFFRASLPWFVVFILHVRVFRHADHVHPVSFSVFSPPPSEFRSMQTMSPSFLSSALIAETTSTVCSSTSSPGDQVCCHREEEGTATIECSPTIRSCLPHPWNSTTG